MGISEPVALNLSSPGERALRLLPGMRVRAVWASWLKLRCHIEAVMFLSFRQNRPHVLHLVVFTQFVPFFEMICSIGHQLDLLKRGCWDASLVLFVCMCCSSLRLTVTLLNFREASSSGLVTLGGASLSNSRSLSLSLSAFEFLSRSSCSTLNFSNRVHSAVACMLTTSCSHPSINQPTSRRSRGCALVLQTRRLDTTSLHL